MGDDDGGRALAIDSRDYRSTRFGEEMFWLGREDAVSGVCTRDKRVLSRCRSMRFSVPDGVRMTARSFSIVEVSACSMAAMGMRTLCRLVLNVGATEILTDPGTYVYNGSPEWRNFFRSTRAHNTVVVDDSDQVDTRWDF